MAGVNSQASSDSACFDCVLNILRRSISNSAVPAQANSGTARSSNGLRPSDREVQRNTLTGEADCSGRSLPPFFSGRCTVRLCGAEIFMKLAEDENKAHSVDCTGANVECTERTLTLSRDSRPFLTMTFEVEKVAGLWATKLAVAGGNSESISKLFSMQHRKMVKLEENSKEARSNNEQVERCLNFLSKEYVDMRHQVRTSKTKAIAPLKSDGPALELHAEVPQNQQAQSLQETSVGAVKRQSEPEKEPQEELRRCDPQVVDEDELLLPEPQGIVPNDDAPAGPPTLLGSGGGVCTAASKQARMSSKLAQPGREAPESSPVGGGPAFSPSASAGATDLATGQRSSRQLIANQKVLNRSGTASTHAGHARKFGKDGRSQTGLTASLR
eukprot:TRINITY_DN594_c0_g1_i1.p1 TRINITY_DN594_c0_g1~~TRINITY_DN594_c0_g1_i1.p1  ORF type:complete len:386 (-),score=88.67 TRINITY_DN594_c0_g1_i1:172-1329(-)